MLLSVGLSLYLFTQNIFHMALSAVVLWSIELKFDKFQSCQTQ